MKASRFLYRRRVAFAETDLAGIMHFANFLRWMEEAEHAFYRSLGLSVHPAQHGFPDTETGWPRVRVHAEYFRPLQFEEEAEVEVLVAEMRTKALRLAFRIWKSPDQESARTLAAAGEFVVVAVRAVPGTREMKSVPIPEGFRERIEAVPAEALELPEAKRS